MKKIRETHLKQEGRSPAVLMERVIEVEQVPEGAEVVPDKTPVTDWQPVNKEKA